MSRSESSSLFKVLRFVKKFGTKLWVWHDQHICYISGKINVVGNFYHMKTNGPKSNGVM